MIDFEGFQLLTDSVGGVDVESSQAFSSGGHSFTKGTNHLDGEAALTFVRARKQFADGDLQSARNQQEFISSLFGKIVDADTLSNPSKVTGMVRDFSPYMYLDSGLHSSAISRYALAMRDIRSDDIDFFTAPIAGAGRSSDGQSYVKVDEDELESGRGLQGRYCEGLRGERRPAAAVTTSPRSRFFRTGAASAFAVTFLVSGCTNGKGCGGTDEASGLVDAGDAVEPFVQDLNSEAPSPDPVDVDVSTDPSSTTLSADNIGISFEATDLADPRWNPDAGNLHDVLAELGSPGLRFGRNQLDRGMFWTSSGEQPPAGRVAVTPEDLNRVARTVEKVDASVTLGIPLGGYDPVRGADMVAHAKQAFGYHLLAVSIGNEPNGFTADHREGLKIRDAAE